MAANPNGTAEATQQTQPQVEATASMPNGNTDAMQPSQSDWQAIQLAAAQAKESLENIPSEISSYLEAALCSAKADIAAAAEAAVAAAAIQSLSAPQQATCLQVGLKWHTCNAQLCTTLTSCPFA